LSAYRTCKATDSDEFRKAINSLVSLLNSEGKLSEAQVVFDEPSTNQWHKQLTMCLK